MPHVRLTVRIRRRARARSASGTPGYGRARGVFQLGLSLVVIAAVASLYLAVVARTGVVGFVLAAGFVSALIYLPLTLWRGVISPLIRGIACPTCRERSLVLVACMTFGDRFYRCAACGQRCKRADAESPWRDASRKEDADMYKPHP